MIELIVSRYDGNIRTYQGVSLDDARASLQESFASEIREDAGRITSAILWDDSAEIHYRMTDSFTTLEIVDTDYCINCCDSTGINGFCHNCGTNLLDDTMYPVQPEIAPM